MEQAQDATEKRKLLENEKELTADLVEKYKQQAEKEKERVEHLTEMHKSFYCELCDRQYTKYSEFDNHINSYSHHHQQVTHLHLHVFPVQQFIVSIASFQASSSLPTCNDVEAEKPRDEAIAYRPLSCATFHCRYRGDVSHDLQTVEVKQENRELDLSKMYRCQKNDLVAK